MREARSRQECQGPNWRKCAGYLSTTSWKLKLSGNKKNKVIRDGDEEEEVNGEVESIRETHNDMTHGTCAR